MSHHPLLRGVSVCALTFALITPSNAQQSLPTIDIGGARAARAGHSAAPRGATGPTTGRVSPGPRLTTPAGSLANSANPDLAASPGFSPAKLAMPVYREPTGQTFTIVRGKDFVNTPLVTVREML
jgi:iron complex outermembrane receptor protein